MGAARAFHQSLKSESSLLPAEEQSYVVRAVSKQALPSPLKFPPTLVTHGSLFQIIALRNLIQICKPPNNQALPSGMTKSLSQGLIKG